MPRHLRSRRPVREINGDLFLISAEYEENRVKSIDLIKEWLGVKYVFRNHKDNTLMFCEKIEEVQFTIIK